MPRPRSAPSPAGVFRHVTLPLLRPGAVGRRHRSCSSSRSRRTASSACSPHPARARSRSRCGATPPNSAVSGRPPCSRVIQLAVLAARGHLGEPRHSGATPRALAIDDTPSRRSPAHRRRAVARRHRRRRHGHRHRHPTRRARVAIAVDPDRLVDDGVDRPRARRGTTRHQPRRRPGRRDPELADHGRSGRR